MPTRAPNSKCRRLTPIQQTISIATALAINFTAAGCFLDRRSDAEHLDRHVRALPGVAATDMTYDKNFTSGENFRLKVTLQQNVTDPQIRDIGKYFADRTDETGLAERSADLSLRLPIVPPPPKNLYGQDYQSAHFSRAPLARPTALPATRSPTTLQPGCGWRAHRSWRTPP
jgi:hypothetical protein